MIELLAAYQSEISTVIILVVMLLGVLALSSAVAMWDYYGDEHTKSFYDRKIPWPYRSTFKLLGKAQPGSLAASARKDFRNLGLYLLAIVLLVFLGDWVQGLEPR